MQLYFIVPFVTAAAKLYKFHGKSVLGSKELVYQSGRIVATRRIYWVIEISMKFL